MPDETAHYRRPESTGTINAEEQEVDTQTKALFERARQKVKALAKAEREGEVVGSDLLNFRMRSCRH